MPRFFVDKPLQPDDVMPLPDDVVRHVLVLRLQPGDSIVLFNGEGGEYSAELVEVERRSAMVKIREFRNIEVEAPYRLTLAQGIAGGDKMDWLIEKAVELGASSFVPLTTTRSVVRLTGERAQRRHAHWQGIVRASCEQCGRNRLPEVMPVREIATWLGTMPRTPEEGDLRILLSPRASISFSALPAEPPKGRVTVLVGPEGGFSATEEAAATDYGFTAVGLGPRVMRTETAGIAVSRRWRPAGAAGKPLAWRADRLGSPWLRAASHVARSIKSKRPADWRAFLLLSLNRQRSSKRVKHPERHLPLGPELRGLAEHV